MDIQLSILQFFQSIRSPILNSIFLIFTISTELPIIVLFVAIMYWCINKKYGQKMLFSLIGNIALNTGIKEFVRAPRPIGVEGLESLRVSTATGYSFPSGHTQTGTTFWASLMIILNKSWMYILGTIMILGIGISRLYLAVHWPIDVIFGWIFGIVFTILFSKIFDLVDKNKKYYILVLLLIPFVVAVFLLNSAEYIKMFGLLTGFVLGYIVEDRFIQFNTCNKNKGRINFSRNKTTRFNNKSKISINFYRFIVGIITLGIVYIVLKYIVIVSLIYIKLENIEMVRMLLDYIRYSLIVFYAVAGVPALFKVLKLN